MGYNIHMEEILMQKLQILADSDKYDVSCSSSGSSRQANGRMGNGHMAGICHSWAADGRCVSLLKVLFTNKCVYNCEYCVNRRTNDFPRASFEPDELARLTMEFYRRNYIEGLFLSSAVEVSPDYTAEKILECLELLRYRYGFAGYIHAKIIPGVSPEILHRIGLVADRLSVNIEMPSRESLAAFAPQKKIEQIVAPMRQITNTLIETKSLKGPGSMFKGENLNDAGNYLGAGTGGEDSVTAGLPLAKAGREKNSFASAGQTTQMIIGAGGESDASILATSENLYRTFKMKRVYYSAYIPVVDSPKMNERIFEGPNTSIRIIDTMITVILPSTIAAREFLVPFSIAPSMVRPPLISSLIRSAVITLQSTPIPIERMIPAIPGSVIVKDGKIGK